MDYKCFAACRNGAVYIIAKGKVESQIQIDSKPIGFARLDKSIVVAAMDNSIQSFSIKGKKNFSVQMNYPIISIVKMESSTATQNVIVALKNGEVRMYNGKTLVDTLHVDD